MLHRSTEHYTTYTSHFEKKRKKEKVFPNNTPFIAHTIDRHTLLNKQCILLENFFLIFFPFFTSLLSFSSYNSLYSSSYFYYFLTLTIEKLLIVVLIQFLFLCTHNTFIRYDTTMMISNSVVLYT